MSAFDACRDATRVVSDHLDGRAAWPRRLAAALHLLVCAACRRYRRQVIAIDRLLRTGRRPAENRGNDHGANGGMTHEARARLIQGLRDRSRL